MTLEDLEKGGGKRQKKYCLLAVKAARGATTLLVDSSADVDTHPD